MLVRHQTVGRLSAVGLAVALLVAAGCDSGPKTHPVRGKVVLEGDDIKKLAGANVEFRLESDPDILSYGEIKEDGSFEMRTMYKGKTVSGAPEGTHKARILLGGEPEDDDEAISSSDPDEAPAFRPKPKKKKEATVIHPRFLSFNTSNLTYKVPPDGDIVITVTQK